MRAGPHEVHGGPVVREGRHRVVAARRQLRRRRRPPGARCCRPWRRRGCPGPRSPAPRSGRPRRSTASASRRTLGSSGRAGPGLPLPVLRRRTAGSRWRSDSVTKAITSRPTIDRIGGDRRPPGSRPYGSAARRTGRARPVRARRAGHAMPPGTARPGRARRARRPGRRRARGPRGRGDASRMERRRGPRAGASRGRRRRGSRGGRRRPPGRPPRARREVRPAEGDAVEHVALAAEDELGVAAVGGPDALHGQAEDGHERLRVPGAARARGARGPGTARSPRRRPAARGPRRAAVRGSAGPPARDEREEPRRERVPAVRGQLEAGGGRVAAVADEQVAAGGEGLGEVEPPVAPARGPDRRRRSASR